MLMYVVVVVVSCGCGWWLWSCDGCDGCGLVVVVVVRGGFPSCMMYAFMYDVCIHVIIYLDLLGTCMYV